MGKKKIVIDELNDGWRTEVGEDGQIGLVQADLEEEETDRPYLGQDDPDDDEDDDEPEMPTQPSGHYWNGGQSKVKCIVCGDEFETTRSHARFCKKPGCRQKFNRQQHKLAETAKGVEEAVGQLVGLLADKNFGAQARSLLIALEKTILARLDEKLPDRHPKPEISARPVLADSSALEPGGVYFVLVDGADKFFSVKPREGAHNGFLPCRPADYHGSQWNEPTLLIPRSSIWLRLVEPGEGDVHDDAD